MGKKGKFERCLLMIEGDILMYSISKGLDILREKLTDDADAIFGSKYVKNNEKKAIVDIVIA